MQQEHADAAGFELMGETVYGRVERRLAGAVGVVARRIDVGDAAHVAGDGQHERTLAAGQVRKQRLRHPHGPEGVDPEGLLPVLVADAADRVFSPALEIDARVVDQQVDGETDLLRRWSRGRILGAPLEWYDPLLVACCPTDWTPAARVVGAAMGRCDPRNRMSDLFFASRLQVFVDSGRVEALGRRDRLREYAVRRAAS